MVKETKSIREDRTKPLVLETRAMDPDNPGTGRVWYNSSEDTIKLQTHDGPKAITRIDKVRDNLGGEGISNPRGLYYKDIINGPPEDATRNAMFKSDTEPPSAIPGDFWIDTSGDEPYEIKEWHEGSWRKSSFSNYDEMIGNAKARNLAVMDWIPDPDPNWGTAASGEICWDNFGLNYHGTTYDIPSGTTSSETVWFDWPGQTDSEYVDDPSALRETTKATFESEETSGDAMMCINTGGTPQPMIPHSTLISGKAIRTESITSDEIRTGTLSAGEIYSEDWNVDENFNIADNQPSSGYVSWPQFNLSYKGNEYTINSGSASETYIWWDSDYPNSFQKTDIRPSLTYDDAIIIYNENGIGHRVLHSTLIHGGRIRTNSIDTNALGADSVTAGIINAGAVDTGAIKTGAIEAPLIAGSAVAAEKIAGSAIITRTLASDAVVANKIGAGEIDTAHIRFFDGTTPSPIENGQMWYESPYLKFYSGGQERTIEYEADVTAYGTAADASNYTGSIIEVSYTQATQNDTTLGTAEPSGQKGDIWIDTDTYNPYIHDGSNWQRATWDTIKNDANAPVDNATQNVDYVQSTEPTGTSGDLWIDTSDNTPFIHDGSNWQRVSWSRIKADNNAPVDNATKNIDYVQATEPTGTSGDIWIDTDTDVPYLNDGTAWRRVDWNIIRTDANAPEDNASSNKYAFGTAPPSEFGSGDLWVDTSGDSREIKNYESGGWTKSSRALYSGTALSQFSGEEKGDIATIDSDNDGAYEKMYTYSVTSEAYSLLDSCESGWNYTENDSNDVISGTQPDNAWSSEGTASLSIESGTALTESQNYGEFNKDIDLTNIDNLKLDLKGDGNGSASDYGDVELRMLTGGDFRFRQSNETSFSKTQELGVDSYTGPTSIQFRLLNNTLGSASLGKVWFDNLEKSPTLSWTEGATKSEVGADITNESTALDTDNVKGQNSGDIIYTDGSWMKRTSDGGIRELSEVSNRTADLIDYLDGYSVEDFQPAEASADITNSATALDTENILNTPAGQFTYSDGNWVYDAGALGGSAIPLEQLADRKASKIIETENKKWAKESGAVKNWESLTTLSAGWTDSFEDGDASGWIIFETETYGATDAHAFHGDYSLGGTVDNTAYMDLARTVNPSYMSGGKQINTFEFFWIESSSSNGGGVQLWNSSDEQVCAFVSDNPQWYICAGGAGEQIWDGGGNYDDWTYVKFKFDWANDEFDYVVQNLNTLHTETGTHSIASGLTSKDVENLNIGGYNSVDGGWVSGKACYMWFDDFIIDGSKPPQSLPFAPAHSNVVKGGPSNTWGSNLGTTLNNNSGQDKLILITASIEAAPGEYGEIIFELGSNLDQHNKFRFDCPSGASGTVRSDGLIGGIVPNGWDYRYISNGSASCQLGLGHEAELKTQ